MHYFLHLLWAGSCANVKSELCTENELEQYDTKNQNILKVSKFFCVKDLYNSHDLALVSKN